MKLTHFVLSPPRQQLDTSNMNMEVVLQQLVDVLALGEPIVQAIVNLGGINTPRKLGMMQEKNLTYELRQ
jgi:hypothetical protein